MRDVLLYRSGVDSNQGNTTSSSRVHSDSHFVARAFKQLWHLGVQGQAACETLPEVLVCLRASLNGAILETLRVSRRPKVVSSLWPDEEECVKRSVIWGRLQAKLSNPHEQRLAYFLFHCGLSPREIVQCYPQEWSDVQEIARLRHTILERLLETWPRPIGYIPVLAVD